MKTLYRKLIKKVLNQFNNDSLNRIINHIGKMCLDGGIYDIHNKCG